MLPSAELKNANPEKTGKASQQNFSPVVTTYQSISVIGLGYVGLPTALLFAQHGFSVTGVDVNPKILQAIREKRVAALYPELTDWWEAVQDSPQFSANAKPVPSDVFILAVPTPIHHETKDCDLTYVISAVRSILPVLQPGNLVILESTVPPGTTRSVVKPLLESTGLKVGEELHLCFSPERILPGNTTQELVQNHRVMGGYTEQAAILAKEVFQKAIQGEIYLTDDITAEFCKLAENTYRDVNIALANELSLIADELGLDIRKAIPLINKHPRVNLLQPGIGVGGHCIAVDPWFFVEVSPSKTELIATSRRVNDRMPRYTAERILQDVEHLQQPKICLVGLTYKPDVGDTRESPALRVVKLLKKRGIDVTTFDPLLPEFQGRTLQEAAKDCDYLAVLVNHSVIRAELSAHRDSIEAAMRTPLIRFF